MSETPYRTPNPLQRSRRRAYDRLGSLRAMGLGAIGDIGSVSFGSITTLSWRTATDWDNSSSESGVVHESVSNSDYTDASVVSKGYSLQNPPLSSGLVAYYLFHNDVDGGTLYDYSGYNNDGSNNGVGENSEGILGGSGWYYDGGSDYTQIPRSSSLDISGDKLSVAMWVKDPSDDEMLMDAGWNSKTYWYVYGSSNSKYSLSVYIGGNKAEKYTNNDVFNDTNWHFITGVYDGSEIRVYNDGSPDGSTSASGNIDTGSNDIYLGAWEDLSSYNNYNLGGTWIWDRALSDSEVASLYDVVTTAGTITSGVKSASTSIKPDLQNLVYNLNGNSASIDVIGSPGTASEEVVTQTLDGATSYSLSWTNSHTDFQIKLSLNSNNSSTPTVSEIEIAG